MFGEMAAPVLSLLAQKGGFGLPLGWGGGNDIILFFWIGLARKKGEEESGGGGSRNVCRVVGPFGFCREVCLGVVVVCWCRLLVCSLGWGLAVALGLLYWVTVVILITKVTPQRCSQSGLLFVVLQRTEQ